MNNNIVSHFEIHCTHCPNSPNTSEFECHLLLEMEFCDQPQNENHLKLNLKKIYLITDVFQQLQFISKINLYLKMVYLL